MKQSDTNTVDAETRNDRILSSFRGAYDEQWHILVQECPQNGADAHGQHVGEGLISDARDILLDHTLDTEERWMEYVDNVGGMPRDVLAEVVTTIAETDDKKEFEESGGSFGLGLWMNASTADEETGGAYIETRREGEDEAHATVLYPDGKHFVSDDGEFVADPETVRETAGISLDATPPSEREEGGTLIRVEGIEQDIIDDLGAWENIEQRLTYKFPTLTGPENIDLRWTIDGEEHWYDAPSFDEFTGDVIERHENLAITKGDDGAVVDELVFYEATEEAPCENIPLMKTQPHTGRPYLVVDDYKVRQAGAITDADGPIVGVARIDTVCDVYEWEDPAHEGVQFTPSQHTEMGDIAKRLQREYVKANIRKHSIDERDVTAAVNDALAETRSHIANIDGAKAEHFGFGSADTSLVVAPHDAYDHDDTTLRVDATVTVSPDNPVPEATYAVDLKVERQSDDEIVADSTETVALAAGEAVTRTVELDVPGDGAYFVHATLRDADFDDEKDTSGVLLGVNKDVAPSGGGGGGGGGGRQTANEDAFANTVVDGVPFRVKSTVYIPDDGDELEVWTEAEDDGFVLYINPFADEWLSAAMSSATTRAQNQKQVAARIAINDILDDLKWELDPTEERKFAFRRLRDSLDEVLSNIN